MTTVPLPRLLDAQLREIRRIDPVRVSIDQTLAPLSSASMTLLPEDTVEVRQFVELFTAQGSAGIFRVTAVEDGYTDETYVTLQHGLVTLQDALMPGEGERDTSARALLEELLTHQKGDIRWTLGDVAVPDSEILHWEYDHSNLLSSLCDILEQLPGYQLTVDQTTQPWVLGITAAETEPSCECRASRNVSGVRVTRDDSDLVTRLYVSALPEPIEADTIGTWGAVERTLTVDEELGEEMIRKAALQQLEAHKNPLITVTLEALELSRLTGEPLDALTLGRLCRVCLPEWGATLSKRIVTLSWPDVYGRPENVTAILANQAEDTADAIAGLVVDTTVLKKGYGDNKKKLTLQAETIELLAKDILLQAEKITANAQLIELKADSAEVKEIDDRITQEIREVGITIDNLQAQIDLKASVEQYSGLDQRISSAEITIDGLNSQIALKADVSVTEGLDKRLSGAEVSIDGLNAKIDLKANTSEVTSLSTRVTSAEAEIDGLDAKITLKADTTVVNEQAERIRAAEVGIDGLNAAITLKADATVTDALGTRLSSAEISIDGLNSQITLKADKIDLQGYVKATELEAEVLQVVGTSYIESLNSGSIGCESISANGGIVCEALSASEISTTSLQVGSTSVTNRSKSFVYRLQGLSLGFETIKYLDSSGTEQSVRVVTDVQLNNPMYDSIDYLG